MMIEKIRAALLIVPGVIHLLPVSGLLGAEKLSALYGIQIENPNLLILMQHRAVLFGILGVLLMVSVFRPGLRVAAVVAGLVSAVSFIAVALVVGGYNEAIHRVVIADVVAVLCLLGAAATFFVPGRK